MQIRPVVSNLNNCHRTLSFIYISENYPHVIWFHLSTHNLNDAAAQWSEERNHFKIEKLLWRAEHPVRSVSLLVLDHSISCSLHLRPCLPSGIKKKKKTTLNSLNPICYGAGTYRIKLQQYIYILS